MTILAVDLGDRRTGLAISDPGGTFALGLPPFEASSTEEVLEHVALLVAERSVSEVVVGLPKNMDDSIGPRARLTLEFVEDLKRRVSVPVTPWDERLTSVEAEGRLAPLKLGRRKKRRQVNTVAAQLILESYLSARRKREA